MKKRMSAFIIFLFIISSIHADNAQLIDEGDIDEGNIPATFALTRQGREFAVVLQHPEPINIYSANYVYFMMRVINAEVEIDESYRGNLKQNWVNEPLHNKNWEFFTSFDSERNNGWAGDDEIEEVNGSLFRILLNAFSVDDILFFRLLKYTAPAYLIFTFFNKDETGEPAKITYITVGNKNITSGEKIPLTYPVDLIEKNNYIPFPSSPSMPMISVLTTAVGVGVGIAIPVVSPIVFRVGKEIVTPSQKTITERDSSKLLKKARELN